MWNGFWRLMFFLCMLAAVASHFILHNGDSQLYFVVMALIFYLFVIESKIAKLEKKLPQNIETNVDIKMDQQVFNQLFVNAITKVGEAVAELQKNGRTKKTTPRGKN